MFDPPRALDGGADGLDAYRKILGMIPKIARPGAVLAFEIGAAQSESVAALIAAHGLKVREIRNDLAGQKRCILADI